jgi:hypothetical protein
MLERNLRARVADRLRMVLRKPAEAIEWLLLPLRDDRRQSFTPSNFTALHRLSRFLEAVLKLKRATLNPRRSESDPARPPAIHDHHDGLLQPFIISVLTASRQQPTRQDGQERIHGRLPGLGRLWQGALPPDPRDCRLTFSYSRRRWKMSRSGPRLAPFVSSRDVYGAVADRLIQ